MTQETGYDQQDTQPEPRMSAPRFGLSGKLLVLTILFVMLAEILIFIPSIANFRLTWLSDRVAAARNVALVLNAKNDGAKGEDAPGAAEADAFKLPDKVIEQILDNLGAKTVAIKMGNQRKLLAVNDMPHEIHHDIDLRSTTMLHAVFRGMQTLLLDRDTDIMRVVGEGTPGSDFIEVLITEGRLRAAMFRFARNILLLSLIISAITATLVYLALAYLFVRPMNRLTANMVSFSRDPENPTRIIAPSGRRDELGIAEHELATMQRDLASMLQQKSHLASLGLAVSKINHDLRNMLASAQLFSDRLINVPDPNVQRFAPKLMQSLERAIAFCQSTLSYGQVKEPPPDRRPVL